MKHWVQIATILSTLTVGTLAAAQDDVAPQAVVLPPEPPRDQPRAAPPATAPAIGGEGRWVFDVLGGQLGGPTGGLGTSALGGTGFLGPFTISTVSNESDRVGLHSSYKSILIALTPSVDVFVTEHFSIGGQIGGGILTSRAVQQQPSMSTLPGIPPPPDNTSWRRGYTLGIAPRVGYAIPLSSSIALWPRIGVGYEVSREEVDDFDAQTVMRTYFVETILGVGVRVSKHAFFDVGPVLSYRHSSADGPTGTPTVYGALVPGSTEAVGGSVRASLRLDF